MARESGGGLITPFSESEGRKFGSTVGLAFVAIAAVLFWRSRETAAYVTGAIGAALIMGGLIAPASLEPVHRAWMAFAVGLSKITTPAFIGIMYYAILTPTGLIRRTFGKSPLRHEPEAGAAFL